MTHGYKKPSKPGHKPQGPHDKPHKPSHKSMASRKHRMHKGRKLAARLEGKEL